MKKLLLTLTMSLLALSISFAQNGKYDLRTTLHHIDCDANKAYFDVAIKASDTNSHFRLGEVDLRFSVERTALVPASVFIEEQLDISGPIISDDGLISAYTHKLLAPIDTIFTYNLSFAGLGGYELTHNKWSSITRLGFDIADVNQCGSVAFNPSFRFPGTDVNANFQGNPFYDVVEGNYENATFCISDYCTPVNTCPNDITFTTQQQIDDFATNYPGCTEIPGDVYVQGINSMSITNLDGLSQLTKIGGVLSIFNNNALTDLSGLHNITTVGDALAIGYNDGLTDLAELSSLTSIGGQFLLFSNQGLIDLGINNLNTISGNMNIQDNHALTNLNMNNLTSVGSNVDIQGNKNLLDLAGLNNLTTIGGDLLIFGNGITSLSLNNLNAINGQLLIQSNYNLTTLDGLENLDYTTIQDLVVTANFDLSFCSTEMVCNYLENGGASTIGNNGSGGCNNINQVQAGCDTQALCASQVLTDTRTLIADNDLFIDAVGFANNPSITLTDATTPAGADLTDISLEFYFRLKGSSCEDEIAIQITDPEGNTQNINAYATCNGGAGLYYVNIDLSDRIFSGNATDWLIEFDDSNNQNAGDEYSVRFARLTYNTTLNTSGGSVLFFRDEITKISDTDMFIDGVGFDNNPSMTFTDPGIPANADLSGIRLELYFRLVGSSCENEIAIQITDPAGNTQPLTAYTTCDGGTGLRYVNLNIPSASTTGTVGDWLVQFDDTNDQNAGDEYSVRFGRLTYRAEYYQCSEEAIVYENDDTVHPIEMQKNLNTSAQQNVSTSAHQNVSTTERQHISTLKLYPVPAVQHLNVDYKAEATSTVHLEVVSNSGSTLMSKQQVMQVGVNTLQFDIAELPAGHYYIRTYSADNAPQMQPFIKIAP